MDKHIIENWLPLMERVKKLQRPLLTTIPLILFYFFGLISCTEKENTVNIAVASNFEKTLSIIVEKYKDQNHSDENINIIAASSGILSNQIINNAPFDLFLSADNDKPHLLKWQLISKNKVAVYAIGQLVLWIPSSQYKNNCLQHLDSIKTLAIANPKTAPYGQLAMKIMDKAQIHVEKTIYTSNVSQAYLYTKDRLTQAGFIAKSLLEKESQGCIQTFNDNQLSQSMLLLNDKANGLYQYILSDEIQDFIQQSGYSILQSDKDE